MTRQIPLWIGAKARVLRRAASRVAAWRGAVTRSGARYRRRDESALGVARLV